LELDREIKERRNEIQRLERRLVQKEEALDRKVESLEQKKNFLIKRRKRFRNFMNRHLRHKDNRWPSLKEYPGCLLTRQKKSC